MTRLSSRLARHLPVRIDEWEMVRPLLAYSFGVGVFGAFYFSLANAQFLATYPAHRVPWAYIAGGILGYLLLRLFRGVAGRVPLGRLVLGMLVVLLVFLGLLIPVVRDEWAIFAMFLAIGPLLTLMDLGFWGLAGRLMDLRQGKRLFGFIALGETLSSMMGLLLVRVLIDRLGPYLFPAVFLTLAMLGVAICLTSLRFLGRRCGDRLDERKSASGPSAKIATSRYFWLIATVMALAIVTHYFVDFAFLSSVRIWYTVPGSGVPDPVQIGKFVGVFFAISKVLELLSKVSSGALVTRYGLIPGLVAFPALVLLFDFSAAAEGLRSFASSSAAEAAASDLPQISLLFFAFVILAKLAAVVLRKSLFDPSFKVLYQPLPSSDRFPVQTRVEGEVRHFVMALAGVFLLALGQATEGRQPVLAATLAAVVLVTWIATSPGILRAYRQRLLAALAALPRTAYLEAPEETLRKRLLTASRLEVRYSLNVLDHIEPTMTGRMAVALLDSAEPEVRMEALARVDQLRLFDAHAPLARRQTDESDPEVRAALGKTLKALEQDAGATLSETQVLELAGSSSARNRRLAAQSLARFDDGPAEALFDLLFDPDVRVRRAALLSAGHLGRPEFWPHLIDQLRKGEVARQAAAALSAVGPTIVESLAAAFNRFSDDRPSMLRVLRICERISGPAAEKLLLEKIDHHDREVQRQAIRSLGVLGFQSPDATIESGIQRRIREALDRLTWYVRSRLDVQRAGGELSLALEVDVERERDAIFLLLALICDPRAVKLMREHLDADSAQDRAIALEIAEQIVGDDDLRRMLLPVFEHAADTRMLDGLAGRFPQPALEPTLRLRSILRQGFVRLNDWNRCWAIITLRRLAPETAPEELVASLFHPSAMVREEAARCFWEIEPDAFSRLLDSLPGDLATELARAADRADDSDSAYRARLLIFERTQALATTPVFESIHNHLLADTAARASEQWHPAGAPLFEDGDPGNSFYVVIEGRIRIEKDGRTLSHVTDGELLGEIAVVETGVRTATATIEEPTRLLQFDREVIHDLMAENIEIVPAIVSMVARRRIRG